MNRSSFPSYFAALLFAGTACGFASFRAAQKALEQMPGSSGATVEGICAKYIALIVLCALGTVLLAGPLCDLLKLKCRVPAVAGAVLCVACLLAEHSERTVLFAALCAIGSGLIYTGAGIDSVTAAPGAARAGMVLASYVPGIALGLKLAPTELPLQYPAMLLIFSGCCVAVLCPAPRSVCSDLPRGKGRIAPGRAVPALLVLLAVFLRTWALGGAVANAPVSDGKFAWLIPAAAVLAGCIAGGLASDVAGGRLCGGISLLLCAPLFVIGSDRFIFYAAALFFAAASVPVTYCSMARLWPGREGLSAAIMCVPAAAGIALSVFLPAPAGAVRWIAAACCAAASVCVYLSADGKRAGQEKTASSSKAEEESVKESK